MASYGQAMPMARPGQQQPPPPGVPAAAAAYHHHGHSTAPQGTFASGTKIQVGSHRVVIQKYLSEGGFAHVYLVKMPTPVDGTDLAVLKRVAVPDKDALRGMRTEVETMKRLKGHRAIVTYIDSHASEMRGGGYEVFLLMEYCDGAGLMDFMNTRLQHRLTEPEIINIFGEIAEGVACMHYLKPPLLHRDLKVENVLISTGGAGGTGRRRFKLCDFGSAAPPHPAPMSVAECRLLDEDVQRHTTLQYRSPEMVDVYRRQPIDEKSDIWALGVLLYKLCYYTTPFEDQSSQLAILNASYRFPSHPVFSDRLKGLIASMLRENQQNRPNIYQVLREACVMQGKEVPIKDIYSGRSTSETRGRQKTSTADQSKPTVVGAVFAPPQKEEQIIPEVVPMRRGRPTAPTHASRSPAPKPSPSPMRVTSGDPFAALDAKAQSADELSGRFPTLDQFSLLHDQGTKFSFDQSAPSAPAPVSAEAQKLAAGRLADSAFAAGTVKTSAPVPQATLAQATASAAAAGKPPSRPYMPSGTSPEGVALATTPVNKPREVSRASAIISSTPELRAISAQKEQQMEQKPPLPARPEMVSTGTMTSPSPPLRPTRDGSVPPFQIFRFPTADHSPLRGSSAAKPPYQDESGYGLKAQPLSQSQSQTSHSRYPSSSRPSLEGGRPGLDTLDPGMNQPRTMSMRQRPASTYLESNLDYLREKESSGVGISAKLSPRLAPSGGAGGLRDEAAIESNVDYLRAKEDDSSNKRDWGLHSKQGTSKRTSMTALSGTKNILAGKFGDAFKRFETTTGSGNSSANPIERTPSPFKQLERQGQSSSRSSSSDERYRDNAYGVEDLANEQVLEETDDMSPEARREIERRRLSMEEKRVAAAGAEYRQRLASRTGVAGSSASSSGPPLPKSIGGVSRAVSIQNRVQSLLSESQTSTAPTRTAQGYGHFTDDVSTEAAAAAAAAAAPSGGDARPELRKKPLVRTGTIPVASGTGPSSSVDAGALPRSQMTGTSKPAAPPKPVHLNMISRTNTMDSTIGTAADVRSGSPTMATAKRPILVGGRSVSPTQLMATDLPGQPVLEGMSLQDRDDYIQDFARRFPSLTTIEMVERDLAAEEEQGRGR